MVDVTLNIPYHHSDVKWSPDGRRLSFASYRVGKDPFASKKWQVFVMELNNPSHKTTAVSDRGMSSVWLNNEKIVVSEGVATNTLSIYDIKTNIKKPFSAIRAGSSAPRFSLSGSHNEVIYYEEIATPEGHSAALIRSYNTHSDKTEDVVKDAGVPWYVK
jgi:WD40 repeat protein